MTEPYPARRFSAYPAGTVTDPESRSFVIACFLEEGDRTELAWLGRVVGAEAIADFVRELGGRKLSARNRRFWSRALGVSPAAPPALAEELWPLA